MDAEARDGLGSCSPTLDQKTVKDGAPGLFRLKTFRG